MSNVILLVFEGEKTEPQIFDSIQKYFFKSAKNAVFYASYKGDIYQLYRKMAADPYQDLIEVMRERDPGVLNGILRKNISQIYLFFDHDAHASIDIDESCRIIPDMISLFDNETENGKLYISYPMIEALKDISRESSICVDRCQVSINNNTAYKQLVGSRSKYTNISDYTKKIWNLLIRSHLIKANCIVNNDLSIPQKNEIETLSQENIYNNQFLKFIKNNNNVAILSGIPLFLVEYFRELKFHI